MTSMQWWRSWHGAPTDHKWAVIAARSGIKTGIVSAVAWALFDYASQNAERGSVEGFDPEEYAVYSGFSEGEIVAVILAMTDKGIITDGTLTNWKKRQPDREDYSTPRVTKHRKMKRNVTKCNAEEEDVTFSSSSSSSLNINSSEKNSFDIHAYKTILSITSWTAIPVGNDEQISIMQSICNKHGERTIEYCQPFYDEYIRRYPRSTRLGWIDWAATGQIPENKKQPAKRGMISAEI